MSFIPITINNEFACEWCNKDLTGAKPDTIHTNPISLRVVCNECFEILKIWTGPITDIFGRPLN